MLRFSPAQTQIASIAVDFMPVLLVVSSVQIVVSRDRSEVTVSADGQVHLTLLRLLLGDRPVALHVSSTAAARPS